MSERKNVGVQVPGIGDSWDPLDHVASEPADGAPLVGPTGAEGRRSDEEVAEEIRRRLAESAMVDASGIEVLVNGGEVFLTGLVPDGPQRELAADVVATVVGAGQVYNRLEVPTQGPPPDPNASDPAVESTITGSAHGSWGGGNDVTS